MRSVGHVAHIGEMRNAYKVLVRKSEVMRPIGKPRQMEDYIKMDHKK
jgi:hypothetical protein